MQPDHRIALIDAARALALLAMAAFHFVWDLTEFGFLTPELFYSAGFRAFGGVIAASFITLMGISLVLARPMNIMERPFLIRLAKIALGAGAITLATYVSVRHAYVRFGILHFMALASMIGLFAWRLPRVILALAALVLAALPIVLPEGVVPSPWSYLIGLALVPPATVDHAPLIPWLSALFAGLLIARSIDWARVVRLESRLALPGPLLWLGRHSLGFYLLHQPVLFALVALAAMVLRQG